MSASNVRVPPDSTGKKIATVERAELHFDNYTGSFSEGDVVVGQTSGASGEVTAVITEGFAAGEGELYLKDVSVTEFQDNENLQVSNVTQATSKLNVDPYTVLHYQKSVITDPDNPEFSQRIDRFGATVNTFTDGAPTFSPFGAMTVGERQTIKDYVMAYDDRSDLFHTETAGAGAKSYDSNAGTSILSCGTASGDLVKRTSHFYHPYNPGIGQLIQMTCQVGDTGKANVRRRWGYFDDNDGIFWELDGTQLAVVMRSSVTGTVVETRVLQQDFNVDNLDGSDSIGFNLDVSLANIYWMDLQWLGSGRVRFGVSEPRGEQLVAHVMEHANTPGASYPYMRSGSLPYRYEQENTGASGSTSEMRVTCASVKHSSEAKIVGSKFAEGTTQSVADTDGETPLMGIRSALLYNGRDNHNITKIISLSVTNAGSTPVIIRAYSGVDAMLTGSSWTQGTGSTSETDMSATAIAGAKLVFSFGCGANATEFFQDSAPRDLHSVELTTFADGATQPMFYLTAEVMGTGTSEINVGFNWEEVII